MTMILSPLDFEHLVQVIAHPACGFRAECLCGWASRWAEEASTADAAAQSHREQVGQFVGTDAAIASLLELQDDLADTIMWLAENWSPDLPALAAHSCTDTQHDPDGVPGVSLCAICHGPDDMARAARRLGGPIVADPEPDATGRRYERSLRRFGHVYVAAERVVDCARH
jgi:hypothetical protein